MDFITQKGAKITVTEVDSRVVVTINGTPVAGAGNGGNGDDYNLPVIGDTRTIAVLINGVLGYIPLTDTQYRVVRDMVASTHTRRYQASAKYKPTSFDVEDADEIYLNGGRR